MTIAVHALTPDSVPVIVSAPRRHSSIVRPFPWSSLALSTHEEIESLRDVRRWAARHVRLNAVEEALGNLAGAKLNVSVRRAGPLLGAGAFGEGLGVMLSSAEQPANGPLALVQVERALATVLAARVLRRPPPVVVDTTVSSSGAIAGALAAILMAAARRAHAAAVLRVVAAGDADALVAEFGPSGQDLLAIALTVLVADDAYAARVVVPLGVIAGAPTPEWSRITMARLGATPLSMPIVACVSTVAASDLACLRKGDVVLPTGFSLVRGAEGPWVGPVLLAPPGGATAIRANLGEGGRLVLRGEAVPLDAAETPMNESDEGLAIVDAVGEIPVVVRVEIGHATMLAREWATIGRGDVIALGQRVGERVVLRVGGVVVARGELVAIDGEVGVRVVERIAAELADA